MVLRSKIKFKFVDGSIKKPAANDEKFPHWDRCNIMVSCWLMNSVIPSIKLSISRFQTAQEMWKDLQLRFARGDITRIADLQQEIFSLSQGDLNVTDYYTKMKTLWDEYEDLRPIPDCVCEKACSCELRPIMVSYYQADKVIRFLKGLNGVYAHSRSQIMMMEPLPSLQKVFSTIARFERQNVPLFEQPISSLAAYSSAKTQNQQSNNQTQFKKAPDGRPICAHCGKIGHIAAKCYRKVGFPPNFKFTKNGSVNAADAVQEGNNEKTTISISQEEYDNLKKQAQISQI
ncbi:uncharacterized protein [Rutidosis leptorrhynchoides]|uniref:uncharacterized protein n=1 Tax=Rutidosis leptorrhynchoides TaxID=125765 RepID=UPI003A99E303